MTERANISFAIVVHFRYLVIAQRNQNLIEERIKKRLNFIILPFSPKAFAFHSSP
jgi:hypothetical protein